MWEEKEGEGGCVACCRATLPASNHSCHSNAQHTATMLGLSRKCGVSSQSREQVPSKSLARGSGSGGAGDS